MIYLMKTCFFFKLIQHNIVRKKIVKNENQLCIYKTIKHYYNAFLKRKNRHIRILDPVSLIQLYLSSNNFKAGLSNLFLKKWFFLKFQCLSQMF